MRKVVLKLYAAVGPDKWRPTRAAGETRVLLCGDSLSGLYAVNGGGVAKLQALGYVVQTNTGAGMGLLDSPCHGILNSVTAQVNSFDPDVVVLEWRGNYQAFSNPGCDPSVVGDTPAFYANWQAEALSMTNAATAKGAQTYWILGPAMASPGSSDNLNDRVTRTIATNLRNAINVSYPKVGIIDAYKLFPDPWAQFDCCGNEVRSWDGLHFSDPLGCQIMADAVIDRLIPHHN